jgi:hypothetical protein
MLNIQKKKKLKGNFNKNSVPQLLGQVNNNVYCTTVQVRLVDVKREHS